MQDTTEPTREDKFTLNEATDMIARAPEVEVKTKGDVWASFNTNGNLQGALGAALDAPGVVVHKAERSEEFLSVVLMEYADEL